MPRYAPVSKFGKWTNGLKRRIAQATIKRGWTGPITIALIAMDFHAFPERFEKICSASVNVYRLYEAILNVALFRFSPSERYLACCVTSTFSSTWNSSKRWIINQCPTVPEKQINIVSLSSRSALMWSCIESAERLWFTWVNFFEFNLFNLF